MSTHLHPMLLGLFVTFLSKELGLTSIKELTTLKVNHCFHCFIKDFTYCVFKIVKKRYFRGCANFFYCFVENNKKGKNQQVFSRVSCLLRRRRKKSFGKDWSRTCLNALSTTNALLKRHVNHYTLAPSHTFTHTLAFYTHSRTSALIHTHTLRQVHNHSRVKTWPTHKTSGLTCNYTVLTFSLSLFLTFPSSVLFLSLSNLPPLSSPFSRPNIYSFLRGPIYQMLLQKT